MIIYFYLFIPLVYRLAESSSIKGGNHRNDLVPFLSSRLDTQKDNSFKIVSNEPFIIQFQMPPQSTPNVHHGTKAKDKKKKRSDKKRMSKTKPLRKKIRKRRSVPESESREEKQNQSPKLSTEARTNQNKTENSISRQEIIKALSMHGKRKETKKLKLEGTKNSKDVEITDVPSSRNRHRNHPPSSPHLNRDPHVKMIYPNTPKSNSHNYSYKDLIADRERLEQKINYIRNMLYVNNDTTTEDGVRVRRKSDSDKTANKIAKMFLTLSAVNGLQDKSSKCHDDDNIKLDIWEKERQKNPSRQSSSSNEERYKVKKWIEYMKSKRSSGKTCPCMQSEYTEENDIFPLEQKLATDYQLSGIGTSSEESSDTYRHPLGLSRGKISKNGHNRNSYKEDARSKLRALANSGRKKYDQPIDDDLELYRSRAKQILQNAEEILDKIKEEEEKRLAAPHIIMSRLRELTSRIQGDSRNGENDLIKIIQKNLGWTPQAKSQSGTESNSFVENMKSFILDPYEKAKALTDESTKKLSSYLLRNLGQIDSTEEQEETGKSVQSPQVFQGQIPQTEEMFSANLAKENPESDTLAKERAEHENWSDTLSAILKGNTDEEMKKGDNQDDGMKQIKDQEEPIMKRVGETVKNQGGKISENIEKPVEDGKPVVFDLMTEEQNETPKEIEQLEKEDLKKNNEELAETFNSERQNDNAEKSDITAITQAGIIEKESEMAKPSLGESRTLEYQQPPEDQTVAQESPKTIGENVDMEGKDEKIQANLPLELDDVKVKASEGEDLPKADETVARHLEDEEDLEDAKADENHEEEVKDTVMESPAEFKKDTGEINEQVSESYQEQSELDDNVQREEDREENDVLNSKHLILEGPKTSDDEELEELKEDIQKLAEEFSEESTKEEKSEENEKTVIKTEYDSSERKHSEEDVAKVSSSSDPKTLDQQIGTTLETNEDELPLENQDRSTEEVQASQDPIKTLQYSSSRNDKTTDEKANPAEGFVENEMPENSGESFVEKESSVEKEENFEEAEKTDSQEKAKLADGETETNDYTLQSALSNEETVKDDTEKEEESENQNYNQEKEILRESLEGAKMDGTDLPELSLKSSLEESDNMQKSSETFIPKYVEDEDSDFEVEESSLRSENPEDETLEKSTGELLEKTSEEAVEKTEEVDKMKNDEASIKTSKSTNKDEIQETRNEENLKSRRLDSQENETESQVSAELITTEEGNGADEESPLRSENPEKQTERSNESLMNTSESQERVEIPEDDALEERNTETDNEGIVESYKATADERQNTEEIESAEDEKVEQQEKENLEEKSTEVNLSKEVGEVNKSPKLLMSIKEGLGEDTMKANEKDGSEENEKSGETLNERENDVVENTNTNEEVSLKAAEVETNEQSQEQDTKEMNEDDYNDDNINVRAENLQDLDNEIEEESLTDGELRSVKPESLNEDATLKEEIFSERGNFNEDGMVEGVKEIKEETKEEETLGKKKNVPASGEIQSLGSNQSKNTLKVPKSIGKIMRDLSGKEKDDYISLTNLNPEKIDHIIDKIDEAENLNKMESEDDCKKECACADEMNTRSRNIGRYEIVKDFLHWVKDLHLNRVLTDD